MLLAVAVTGCHATLGRVLDRPTVSGGTGALNTGLLGLASVVTQHTTSTKSYCACMFAVHALVVWTRSFGHVHWTHTTHVVWLLSVFAYMQTSAYSSAVRSANLMV